MTTVSGFSCLKNTNHGCLQPQKKIMADDNKPKKGQINIELDADVAQGIYSNLAIINHSQSEFVVDFVSIMPGVPKSKVKSRIVLTPQHAKRFLKALNENVSRFEKNHGPIKENNQPQMPINFGPTGEA
ncbi:MAG: hypothetical protein ACJA1Z_000498 [Patiriisocius sp.]